MNIIQPILDFILSFFKLSINRILIALLSMGLAFSLYELVETNKQHKEEMLLIKKEYKTETDTLRSIIIKTAIATSITQTQMMKDCYEDKQKISQELSKINKNK